MLVPAGAIYGIHAMLLRRTNDLEQPGVRRLFLGYNLVVTGLVGFVALVMGFQLLFAKGSTGGAGHMAAAAILVYCSAWAAFGWRLSQLVLGDWTGGTGGVPDDVVAPGPGASSQPPQAAAGGGGLPRSAVARIRRSSRARDRGQSGSGGALPLAVPCEGSGHAEDRHPGLRFRRRRARQGLPLVRPRGDVRHARSEQAREVEGRGAGRCVRRLARRRRGVGRDHRARGQGHRRRGHDRSGRAGALAGKLVLDATNPISDEQPDRGVLRYFTAANESLMERLQRKAPDARFVKAFNSVGAAFMVSPKFDPQPTMFICGDDAGAKQVATEILARFGWEAVDMGGVEVARPIEALCQLWCAPGFLKQDWAHAFKYLRPS